MSGERDSNPRDERDERGGGGEKVTSSNRLYLGSLPSAMDKDAIEQEFKVYGPVTNLWVARNPPGFGFIEFGNERDAGAALKGLDGREFFGQRMRVEFARAREPGSERRPRGGLSDRGPPSSMGGRDSRDFDDRRRGDDRRRDDRDAPRDDRRGGGGGGRDSRDDPRSSYPGAMNANPYAAYYAAAYGQAGGYPSPYGMHGGMPPYGMPPYGSFPDSRAPSMGDRYGSDARGRSPPPPPPRRDDYSGPRRGVGPPQGREHICFNCNLTGHWAKDCPKPKNQGECYTCGERGHAQRDCPKGRPAFQMGKDGQSGGGGAAEGQASHGRSPERDRRSRSRSRSRGRGGRSPPDLRSEGAPNGGSGQRQGRSRSPRSRSPRK